MEKKAWASAWEIGVPEIDADHHLLIDESNALIEALMEARPKTEIMTIIKRMETECQEHFRREENILRETEYFKLELDKHAAEHRRIEQELGKVVRAMGADDVSVTEWNEFILLFQSILIDHLLHLDLQFKSHLLWHQGR